MFRNPLTDGLVVLVILILFFGPKRLPMLSRSIGESFREFKGGIGGGSSEEEEKEEDKRQLSAQSESPRTESEKTAPAREMAETPAEPKS